MPTEAINELPAGDLGLEFSTGITNAVAHILRPLADPKPVVCRGVPSFRRPNPKDLI